MFIEVEKKETAAAPYMDDDFGGLIFGYEESRYKKLKERLLHR